MKYIVLWCFPSPKATVLVAYIYVEWKNTWSRIFGGFCTAFHSYLLSNKKLLGKISSTAKYAWANKGDHGDDEEGHGDEEEGQGDEEEAQDVEELQED